MKLHSRLLLPLLCLATLWLPAITRADTTSPMFGGTSLDINGDTYNWDYADEDGTWHYDYYTGPYGSVTVAGMIGFPNLASVSGGVDGHLDNGSYGDNYWESGAGGGYGFWESYQYSVDFALGELYWVHHTTDNDGWGNESSSWDDSHGEWASWSRSYYDDYNGNISWSESWDGSASGPGWRSGGSTQAMGPGSDAYLFGQTFTWSSENSTWEQGSDGTENGTGSTSYSSGDGSLSVSYSYDNLLGTVATSISGWTPEIGLFSASLDGYLSDWNTVDWDARTAPSFTPDHFWVDGWLVSWQSGVLSSNGGVVDVYTGADGLLEVRLTGDAREFVLGNQSAEVKIQGSVVGSVDTSGQFAVNGWLVTAVEATQERIDPILLTSRSIWVDGAEYAFQGGFSDDNRGHVDVYALPGTGVLRLAGVTGGTVQVAGNFDLGFFSGSLAGGVFSVAGHVLEHAAPLPALPEALWVRSGLYTPAAEGPVGTYEWAVNEETVYTLTVTSQPGGQWAIAGEDGAGPFSGTVDAKGGMAFLRGGTAEVTVDVPVLAADATGDVIPTTTNLQTTYPNHPLNLEVGGATWKFVGTVQGGTAACYVPLNLVNATACLWIDLTTGVVTHRDHVTEPPTVTEGDYTPATHLFQTQSGSAGGLQTVVHAVVYNLSYVHWGMPVPAGSDLPPSFIVRGAPWWYAGMEGSGDDAAAVFRGFYEGQEMRLRLSDGLVSLINRPLNGLDGSGADVTTSGTLSSERRSVRLRDGTVVLSGLLNGQEQVVSVAEVNKLQTVDADLDILGNSLSFGILKNNANLAGSAWWFEHRDSIARLHNILGDPQAEWQWWKTGQNQDFDLQPVMKLDTANRLNLYPSGGTSTTQSGVVLDPTPGGVSTIRGVLRVRPGGDIPMDPEFQDGPMP